MKTKRKNIFKSLLALTLALIMVLGVAPISELAGVDWASLFAPKAEAIENNRKEVYIVKDGKKVSILSPESAVDIYMANKSIWMENPEYSPMNGYGYCLLDLDFDGVLELISSVCDGSGRYSYNKFYRINIKSSSIEEFKSEANQDDGGIDYYDSARDSKLLKNQTSGKKFYVFKNYGHVSSKEVILSYSESYMEKTKFHENFLFSEYWHPDYDNNMDDTVREYTFRGKKVSKTEYEQRTAAFYSENKDLNLVWTCIPGADFDKSDDSTQRQLLLNAYRGFSYDGFSFNNITETDSYNDASISTINTDSTSVSVGDSIEITFKLKDDANDSKKPNISIVVENPEIFESSVKNKKDCAVVKLTAKKVGTTTLTVTEKSTGEILYYSLNAVAQINAFDLNTVPRRTDILKNHVTNFYGYGGLIVDGMTSTKLSNGNYKVSMSVYNTKNIYGAVVTYYEDGSVCDYRMIDRFDCYETGLWDVLESMYYFPGQTANLFRKYTLYTNGNLAQKTAIDGIIVPKGGYMQITNNSEESAIAYLYNIINFAVAGTLSAAGVITTMAGINVVDKSNVASKTAAEAIMKTIKSMPKDKAADVMEDLLKDIAKQNMEAKSYDQIDDMIASTNNVLARAANIDMKSFISSSLKAVGISVAENAILSFLSTPGKWLSAIFTINSGVSYLDFSFSFVKSYKNTSIYVNAPRNGTISTMNGVKIDTQNNVDVKTVMQAFKIIDTSTITVNLSRNEIIEKSQIYNVYFTRDNEKVQPSGSVKIYLPLPDDYDPENSYILRQESNGKWTKLETKRENGYLVAETDHFSLYAVAQVSKKDSIFKKIWNVILAPFRAISRFFKNLFKKIFKK